MNGVDSSKNYESSPVSGWPDPSESLPPQSSQISENRQATLSSDYFTSVMPPLTPEEEKMVDTLVPDDILFEFNGYKCFPHPILTDGLTYGELWRYTGADGMLKIDHDNSAYIKLPNGDSAQRYPSILPHLKSVKKLQMSGHKYFSKDVAQMTWLRELNASGVEYPEDLSDLKNLELLYLGVKGELPDIFDNFKSLKYLRLYQCSLSDLPPSIFRLEALEELGLERNELTYIPKGIAQLTNLKILDLSWNPIQHIPDEICELTNLEELILIGGMASYKGFMSVTDDLSVLSNSLPENIGNLSNLKRLTVEYFPITRLPDSICNLTGLNQLSLYLPLKSIPDNLGDLKSITYRSIYVLNDDIETHESGPLQEEVYNKLWR